MKKAWALSYPLSAQRRLRSEWVDAQADLSLHWANMPFCWFCHEVAQFFLNILVFTLQSPTAAAITNPIFGSVPAQPAEQGPPGAPSNYGNYYNPQEHQPEPPQVYKIMSQTGLTFLVLVTSMHWQSTPIISNRSIIICNR